MKERKEEMGGGEVRRTGRRKGCKDEKDNGRKRDKDERVKRVDR